MGSRWYPHHHWGQTAYHGAFLDCLCGSKVDITPWSTGARCLHCGREFRIERKCYVRKPSAHDVREKEAGGA